MRPLPCSCVFLLISLAISSGSESYASSCRIQEFPDECQTWLNTINDSFLTRCEYLSSIPPNGLSKTVTDACVVCSSTPSDPECTVGSRGNYQQCRRSITTCQFDESPFGNNIPELSFGNGGESVATTNHSGRPGCVGSGCGSTSQGDLGSATNATLAAIGVAAVVLSPLVGFVIGATLLGGLATTGIAAAIGSIGIGVSMGLAVPGLTNRLSCDPLQAQRIEVTDRIGSAYTFLDGASGSVGNGLGAIVGQAGAQAGYAIIDKACDPADSQFRNLSNLTSIPDRNEYENRLNAIVGTDIDEEFTSEVTDILHVAGSLDLLILNDVQYNEKYSGAVEAGDADWTDILALFAERSGDGVFHSIENTAALFDRLADTIVARGVDMQISTNPYAAAKEQILSEGLTEGQQSYFESLGFNESAVVAHVSTMNVEELDFGLTGSTASEILRFYANALRGNEQNLETAYRGFFPGTGDEVSPPAAEGSDGGNCFIATAAYGSYLDPNVVVLRNFRDEWLLGNEWGEWIVDVYYRHSPTLAEIVRTNTTARYLALAFLSPIVFGVKYPAASVLLIVVASFFGRRMLLQAIRRLGVSACSSVKRK